MIESVVPSQSKIGIIAGSGNLFTLVMEAASSQLLFPVVVSFNGFDSKLYPDVPYLCTSIGKIGEILDFLNNNGVKHLIFAGKIQRPSLTSLGFDAVGVKWMQKLGMKAFAGDDALLKGITLLLEADGFKIISPRDYLPNLVLKPGVYTDTLPTDIDAADITRGCAVLNAMSGADVGQACVVQEGIVLGVEAIEGTKNLIERCVNLKRAPNGGVLVKVAKANQSTLIDLPTIGTDTVESVKLCGLNGIAISAHTTQVLNFKEVINLCNQYKIFLKVIEVSQ